MYSIMLYLRRCSVTKLRTLKGLNNWSWKRKVFKMVCVILTGEKDRRNTNLWSQRTKDPGLTFTTIYFSCKRDLFHFVVKETVWFIFKLKKKKKLIFGLIYIFLQFLFHIFCQFSEHVGRKSVSLTNKKYSESWLGNCVPHQWAVTTTFRNLTHLCVSSYEPSAHIYYYWDWSPGLGFGLCDTNESNF